MPTSHAEKTRAHAYAAERGISYLIALRVIRQANDPMSFRTFLETCTEDGPVPAALIDAVRADPKFPGGRAINGVLRYELPGTTAIEISAAVVSYRQWLHQFGLIGRIVSAGRVRRRSPGAELTGLADWRRVAFDTEFPTGDDIDVINEYLDHIDADDRSRMVVAAEYDTKVMSLGHDAYAEIDEQRWQYGVAFRDGSVGWRFNGSTSQERAEELIAQWSSDTHLVRRPVDERGRPIGDTVEAV